MSGTPYTFVKRNRVYIACVNCRKRKVKVRLYHSISGFRFNDPSAVFLPQCITDETEQTPCERCVRKGLHCEYLAVGVAPRGRGDAPLPPPSGPQPGPYPAPSPPSSGYGNYPQSYGTGPHNHNYMVGGPPAGPTPSDFHGMYNGSSNSPAHQQGHRIPPVSGPYQGPSQSHGQHNYPLPSTSPPQQMGSSGYPPTYGYSASQSSGQSMQPRYATSTYFPSQTLIPTIPATAPATPKTRAFAVHAAENEKNKPNPIDRRKK